MNTNPRCLGGRRLSRGGRPGGVTLIEVLIVMAIIALLVAIFLPAVLKAKRHTQRTICRAYEYNIYRAESCRAAQLKLEAFDCGCYGELGKGLDIFTIPPGVSETDFRQELHAEVIESCRAKPRPGG
jgi:prepilin-type N-terminal cleavage/methylation domain-containing protein